MARPKSGDKRTNILNAAIGAIAEEGLGASTSKMAKLAGVAEGTVFTYFATKDEMYNQLYLELKREVYEFIDSGFPYEAAAKAQAKHFWYRFVDWGIAHPQKRHALAHLAISDKVTDATKSQATLESAKCYEVLEARLASGSLKDVTPTFVTAIMASLAETTMEFMTRTPEHADVFRDRGFDAFWRATGK